MASTIGTSRLIPISQARTKFSSPRGVREIIGLEMERALGRNPRYLAVDTSNFFPYGGLYPKLIKSETTASFFSHGCTFYSQHVVLTGVTIYDTKTGHVVGNQGYVSVD